MTTAEPAQPRVPLSWRCGYADLPGGRVCTVQLEQASHAYKLLLAADDLERLGRDLISAARQARTGLVVATTINGQPPRG
jgi:hypothetical protein